MRVYYWDTSIRITSYSVGVHGHRYSLGAFDLAWRAGRATIGRRAAIAGSLLVAAVLARLVVGRLGWSVASGSLVLLALALLGLRALFGALTTAAFVHALEDIRRYGRRLELWAVIAGTPTLLLCTDDALRYGQVCRALTRAINDRDSAEVISSHGVPRPRRPGIGLRRAPAPSPW
jgi:hypothetical protein